MILGRLERRQSQSQQAWKARPRRVFPDEGKNPKEALMRQLEGFEVGGGGLEQVQEQISGGRWKQERSAEGGCC